MRLSDLAPGSPKAAEAGCRCPRMDNAHGRGWMGGVTDDKGRTIYVYSSDCPIHNAEVPDEAE